MRIFKVSTGLDDSTNWSSYNVVAETAKEAITKAEKLFTMTREFALEVELLASADE